MEQDTCVWAGDEGGGGVRGEGMERLDGMRTARGLR